ncbi:MAG: metallopeptidase TldD-related protein [Rhodobacteraceae bacterium]|nr:metallopeptidase TldD-related protein [Paracoccaceae bacterium]
MENLSDGGHDSAAGNAQRFRPFETNLDREAATRVLRDASIGSDDCELFLERQRSEHLLYDDNRVKSASYSAHEGFGLRVVRQATAGYAHASEISEKALKKAAATARLAARDGGGTLDVPPRSADRRLYAARDPVAEAAFSERVELLEEINSFVRQLDNRVVQVTANIATSFQEIEILRPDGHQVGDVRPMARCSISVILLENGRRESGYSGHGGRVSASSIMQRDSWQELAREAVRIAGVNLRSEAAPAGVYDVALGPGWPGILLHEAIGHGLEGDFNRKGVSAFSNLMGRRVAAKGVTVLDDGSIKDRRGSITIDDEGTPGQRNTLIEDGILVKFMQDRQNARLTGNRPTGNGRRQSYAHAPMPRMTNTFMLPGDADPEDIIKEVRDGVYAVGFGGGQVDITNGKFVFSCTEAYRVRNGKVGAPIRNATLIGDGPSALTRIRAVGNDLGLDPGIGNCGKNGQWVPVGVGLPTTLIGGLTVGGSSE